MSVYEIHPVADLFPALTADEMSALRESISRSGQHIPISVYEGQVVDGRHRYWACKELGIEPKVIEIPAGTMTPTELVNFAITTNTHRRHLTTSQKAALAASALPLYEEEARSRMLETLKRGESPGTAKLQEREVGQSTEFAAAAFSVSARYVAYAKAIKDWDEVTFQAVLRGELGLQDAAKIMKKQMDEALPPDEADKPLKVPNPPQKWEADIKYDVYAGGVHVSTFHFSSDTLQWDATYHVN